MQTKIPIHGLLLLQIAHCGLTDGRAVFEEFFEQIVGDYRRRRVRNARERALRHIARILQRLNVARPANWPELVQVDLGQAAPVMEDEPELFRGHEQQDVLQGPALVASLNREQR